MRTITIDLADIGADANPGDLVIFQSPDVRESMSTPGRLVTPAPNLVYLDDGRATVDLEEGPVRVSIRCRNVLDSGPFESNVPAGDGPLSLAVMLASTAEYPTKVESETWKYSQAAKKSAAEALDSERKSKTSETNAKSSETRAKTSETNAKTSENNAKRSETNAKASEDESTAQAELSMGAATLAINSAAALERHVADRDPTANDTAYKGAIWVAPSQVWIRGEGAWHPISANDIDKNYVDAQIDEARWYRGALGASDNLDDYRGPDSQGLYRITPAVGGGPNLPGWVEVTYDGNSARTRQVFTASSPSDSVSLERKYSGGRWREWSPVTWRGVVVSSGSADDLLTPHVYAINATGVANLPVPLIGTLETLPAGAGATTLAQIFTSSESIPRTWKRTRRSSQWNEWVQLATEQDVESIASGLIDEARWYQGVLGSSDSLDGYHGLDSQGLYRVTTSVGGGTGLTGWVEVTYDSGSARTRQVFTASSPSESVSLERKYSGGSWRDWSPVTWHGVVVSSGSADDLITPHVYAISTIGLAGLPTDTHGSLEVLPAGTDSLSLTQIFTSSESTPRTWKRTRRAGQWNEWVQLTTGQDVEDIVVRQLGDLGISITPPPLVMSATETPTDSGGIIVNAWSNDGTVGYNALGPSLRQTFDEGATWETVRTFGGNYVEWSYMLPNGELMVSTSGSVGGVSGRRVWVSTGYTPENPTAASWDVVLMPHAPYVKFADWSVSINDEMILLAEYGPKSGMAWSGVPMIPEGQNARYIYQSTDNGRTWETIFDLNDFLLSNGRESADRQHLHGVSWDKYWSRIWVTFGDASGDGSNGVLYSDDEGATWQAAYWTHTHTSLGWQVVGVQPMRDTVLFAGDMSPSGVVALDRAEGRDAFNFYIAWDFSKEDKHLCHVIRHREGLHGEIALFAFSREGAASPSFILGTRDGLEFEVLWQEEGASSPGIRSLAGPSADGTVIASVNSADGWREVKGKLTLYGTPWRDDEGGAALRELGGKADKADVDSADRELGDQIAELENLIGASKAKAGQVPKWDGHQFGWSWMDQHTDLYDDSY